MKKIIIVSLIASAAFGLITYTGDAEKYSEKYLYYSVGQARYDYFRTGTLGGQGEGAWAAECEMLVDGSTDAVVFSFGPPLGEVWAVDGFIMYYLYPAAGGDSEWGDTGAALTNGVLFRFSRGSETTALFNMVKNDDEYFYNFMFMLRPLILDGNEGDSIDVVIRDDLTVAGSGTTMSVYAYAYRIAS